MRDTRSRLERLEQEAQRRTEDRDGIPSMQAFLNAIDSSPQADEFCELARRLVLPDTPPDEADRIRQTLDDWTLEIITRLADGQPIGDVRLDLTDFPVEWFEHPVFARIVGTADGQAQDSQRALERRCLM